MTLNDIFASEAVAVAFVLGFFLTLAWSFVAAIGAYIGDFIADYFRKKNGLPFRERVLSRFDSLKTEDNEK